MLFVHELEVIKQEILEWLIIAAYLKAINAVQVSILDHNLQVSASHYSRVMD